MDAGDDGYVLEYWRWWFRYLSIRMRVELALTAEPLSTISCMSMLNTV